MKKLFGFIKSLIMPSLASIPTLPIKEINIAFANYTFQNAEQNKSGDLVLIMLSPDLGNEQPQLPKRLIIKHVTAQDISIVP